MNPPRGRPKPLRHLSQGETCPRTRESPSLPSHTPPEFPTARASRSSLSPACSAWLDRQSSDAIALHAILEYAADLQAPADSSQALHQISKDFSQPDWRTSTKSIP